MRTLFVGFLSLLLTSIASAHDIWVETNTSMVRLGDIVHIDLKLGNHGNDHRDFKLASKVSLDSSQIMVIGPGGETLDLKSRLIDTGLSPKEGYWTSRYRTSTAGLHVVSSISDNLRGTTRSIKSAKAYFMASKKLDDVPVAQSGFDKPLGHGIEIVPLVNPVTAMGAGQPITVKVMLDTMPLKGARVSFIPRGVVLSEGFDKEFEGETNADGVAEFTPKEGNVVLVAVHHTTDQKGDGYAETKYSATLTIAVPQLCPH